MRKLILYCFLLYFLFVFSGCATVISGTHQYVEFKEEESQSVDSTNTIKEVRVKRAIVGPQYAVNPKDRNHRKKVKKTFNEVSLLNFIVIPFWLVDILTGAVVKYKQ